MTQRTRRDSKDSPPRRLSALLAAFDALIYGFFDWRRAQELHKQREGENE